MNDTQIKLLKAVGSFHCSVLKDIAGCDIPERSNSLVRYAQWNITREILETACHVFTHVYKQDSSITEQYPHLKGKEFSADDLTQFGSNYVQVFGAAPEPTHIHASTIIAQVVQGKGTLIHEDAQGDEVVYSAGEGDTIVIPVGAPHFFHGNPLVVYSGIEFGPVIDYQKHHLK
jgi:hypothetical protein